MNKCIEKSYHLIFIEITHYFDEETLWFEKRDKENSNWGLIWIYLICYTFCN